MRLIELQYWESGVMNGVEKLNYVLEDRCDLGHPHIAEAISERAAHTSKLVGQN